MVAKKRATVNARAKKDAGRAARQSEPEQAAVVQNVMDLWQELPPDKRQGGQETWYRFIGENTSNRDLAARDTLQDWEGWKQG